MYVFLLFVLNLSTLNSLIWFCFVYFYAVVEIGKKNTACWCRSKGWKSVILVKLHKANFFLAF